MIFLYWPFTLLFLFLLCGEVTAQPNRIYPAEKNGLWGFINDKGTWVEEPHFVWWFEHNQNHNLYFMVRKDSLKYGLIVYDGFGKIIKDMPDTMQEAYGGWKYNIKGRYSPFDIENEIMYGIKYRDSAMGIHNEIRASSFWRSDYQRWTEYPDSMVSIDKTNQTFKLWFKYNRMKRLGNLEPISRNLFLVYAGGYTVGKHHPSVHYKSGCVVENREEYYEQLEVKEGKWVLMDKSGRFTYTSSIKDRSAFQPYYPSYHPVNKDFRDNHLAFVMVSDINKPKRVQDITLLNNRGEPVFEEVLKDSASYRLDEWNGFYIMSFTYRQKNYKTIIVNYNGDVTDTFQSITRNHYIQLCAVQKNNKWGIMNFDGKIVSNHDFSYGGQCFPVNDHTLWYSSSDTTLNVIDLKQNQEISIKAGSIIRVEKGYYLVELIKQQKKMGYGLIDSLGNLLFSSDNNIEFEDTSLYSDLKKYKKAYGITRIDDDLSLKIYDRQPVKNAFTVNGFFVRSQTDYLDSLFKPVSISEDWIYRTHNGFTVFTRFGYYFGRYRFYFKHRLIADNLSDYPRLYSSPSTKISLLYYSRYFIYLSEPDHFLITDEYLYEQPQIYGDLMRFRFYHDRHSEWLYLDWRGKIIYTSNPEANISFKKMKWRKFEKFFRKQREVN